MSAQGISGLDANVGQLLASFFKAKNTIALSRVSKEAQLLFSNDFFKNYLANHYPTLEPAIREEEGYYPVFNTFSTYIPHCCWKITCVFLEHSCIRTAAKINFTFFSEVAAPSIRKAAEVKIMNYKSKMEEICGSPYQDFKSPIHQAWLATKDTQLSSHREYQEIFFNKLLNIISSEELQLLKKSIYAASDFSNPAKWWKEEGSLPEDLEKIRNKIITFPKISQSIQTLHELELEISQASKYKEYRDCQDLEKNCKSGTDEICGSSYQDFKSPIHQAWRSIEDTPFAIHSKYQEILFNKLLEILSPEELQLLKKSIYAAPDVSNPAKWWKEYGPLREDLEKIRNKLIKIPQIPPSIQALHELEIEMSQASKYKEYRHYQDLEMTRKDYELELESTSRRLPFLALPPSLTQREIDVINAYNLAVDFLKDEEEWVNHRTKDLPNAEGIKNHFQEFQTTRSMFLKAFSIIVRAYQQPEKFLKKVKG